MVSRRILLGVIIVIIVAAATVALSQLLVPTPTTITTAPMSSPLTTKTTTTVISKLSWSMGTTKEGSTGYVMIGLMCELLRRYSGEYIDCLPVPYGTSTAGLKGFDMKEVDGMYASLQQVEQILSKTGAFQGYNWSRPFAQMIWMYNIKWFFIIRADLADKVKSWSDLKGLKVWPQAKGTSTYELLQIVLGPKGLNIWDSLDIKQFDMSQAADALKLGEVDAVAGYNGASFVQEVLTRVNAVILLPTPEELEIMLKAASFATTTTLYPEEIGVSGALKEAVKTIGVPYLYIVDPSLSEEHAYIIVKTLFEHADELAKSNALWREFASDPIGFNVPLWEKTCGMGVPLHPGVMKYLMEKGVTLKICK